MAWRFQPVVGLILVATFATEVRSEDALSDLNLTIGMRLHIDLAYASRALVFAKIEKFGFGHYRLRSCHPIQRKLCQSLLQSRSLAYRQEKLPTRPKGPRQGRGIKPKLCWCDTIQPRHSLCETSSLRQIGIGIPSCNQFTLPSIDRLSRPWHDVITCQKNLNGPFNP